MTLLKMQNINMEMNFIFWIIYTGTTVENFTALHVAAHSGHVELIEILLSKYKVRILLLGLDENWHLHIFRSRANTQKGSLEVTFYCMWTRMNRKWTGSEPEVECDGSISLLFVAKVRNSSISLLKSVHFALRPSQFE